MQCLHPRITARIFSFQTQLRELEEIAKLRQELDSGIQQLHKDMDWLDRLLTENEFSPNDNAEVASSKGSVIHDVAPSHVDELQKRKRQLLDDTAPRVVPFYQQADSELAKSLDDLQARLNAVEENYEKSKRRADEVTENVEQLRNLFITLAPVIQEAQQCITERKADLAREDIGIEEKKRKLDELREAKAKLNASESDVERLRSLGSQSLLELYRREAEEVAEKWRQLSTEYEVSQAFFIVFEESNLAVDMAIRYHFLGGIDAKNATCVH